MVEASLVGQYCGVCRGASLYSYLATHAFKLPEQKALLIFNVLHKTDNLFWQQTLHEWRFDERILTTTCCSYRDAK